MMVKIKTLSMTKGQGQPVCVLTNEHEEEVILSRLNSDGKYDPNASLYTDKRSYSKMSVSHSSHINERELRQELNRMLSVEDALKAKEHLLGKEARDIGKIE